MRFYPVFPKINGSDAQVWQNAALDPIPLRPPDNNLSIIAWPSGQLVETVVFSDPESLLDVPRSQRPI